MNFLLSCCFSLRTDFVKAAVRLLSPKPPSQSSISFLLFDQTVLLGIPSLQITSTNYASPCSDFRQVPSHQEVYLSRTTLTNLVIEINQYVSAEEAGMPMVQPIRDPQTGEPDPMAGHPSPDLKDKSALLYHLHDLIDETDTLNVISTPQRVQLSDSSLSNHSTWLTKGKVHVRTPVRGNQHHQPQTMESVLSSPEGQPQTRSENSTTTIHLLLVRIPEKETDLLVQVNVPYKELNQETIQTEEQAAEMIMERIIGSLGIRDWGLFA